MAGKALRAALEAQTGVAGVPDLHVRALGSKQPVMTAHVAADRNDPNRLRRELSKLLHDGCKLVHANLNVEEAGCGDHGLHA